MSGVCGKGALQGYIFWNISHNIVLMQPVTWRSGICAEDTIINMGQDENLKLRQMFLQENQCTKSNVAVFFSKCYTKMWI
jgi:hypothetical protein